MEPNNRPDWTLLGPHGDDPHSREGVVVDPVPDPEELKHSSIGQAKIIV